MAQEKKMVKNVFVIVIVFAGSTTEEGKRSHSGGVPGETFVFSDKYCSRPSTRFLLLLSGLPRYGND
jgi:hypothetical protein